MKKYCFKIAFENVSVGYILADTWVEAILEAQRIRVEKYPDIGGDEDDIVEVTMVGDSIEEAP